MTCAEVLNAMLECDPVDLEASSEHPIAMHVRECARCGTVASSLTRGMSLLVVPETGFARGGVTRRRRTRVRAVAIMALPIAAGLALMVARGEHQVAPVVSTASPPVATVTPDLAVPTATPMATVNTPAPRTLANDEPVVSEVVAQGAIEDTSLAFLPPIDIPFSATDSTRPPSVRVTPVSGQRVAILKTSDPKVTVVWIY